MKTVKTKQVQNLEMLLRNEKLKPAEFSRILHIHESQVSDWRSGKHSISVKNANKICAAFPAYDLDFILGNTPYPNKQSEKNDEAYKENSLHEAVELLANRRGVTVTAFCTFDSREYTELYESGQHSTVEIMDKLESVERFERVSNSNGETLVLTDEQWKAFVDEVCGYVEMRLNLMLERGAW